MLSASALGFGRSGIARYYAYGRRLQDACWHFFTCTPWMPHKSFYAPRRTICNPPASMQNPTTHRKGPTTLRPCLPEIPVETKGRMQAPNLNRKPDSKSLQPCPMRIPWGDHREPKPQPGLNSEAPTEWDPQQKIKKLLGVCKLMCFKKPAPKGLPIGQTPKPQTWGHSPVQ